MIDIVCLFWGGGGIEAQEYDFIQISSAFVIWEVYLRLEQLFDAYKLLIHTVVWAHVIAFITK